MLGSRISNRPTLSVRCDLIADLDKFDSKGLGPKEKASLAINESRVDFCGIRASENSRFE